MNRANFEPQNTRTNVPGADYHSFGSCKSQYVIQPCLFAFWKHAGAELKEFARKNLQESEEWIGLDMTSYSSWLVEKRSDTFNYLYLFWWLLVYHSRV